MCVYVLSATIHLSIAFFRLCSLLLFQHLRIPAFFLHSAPSLLSLLIPPSVPASLRCRIYSICKRHYWTVSRDRAPLWGNSSCVRADECFDHREINSCLSQTQVRCDVAQIGWWSRSDPLSGDLARETVMYMFNLPERASVWCSGRTSFEHPRCRELIKLSGYLWSRRWWAHYLGDFTANPTKPLCA